MLLYSLCRKTFLKTFHAMITFLRCILCDCLATATSTTLIFFNRVLVIYDMFAKPSATDFCRTIISKRKQHEHNVLIVLITPTTFLCHWDTMALLSPHVWNSFLPGRSPGDIYKNASQSECYMASHDTPYYASLIHPLLPTDSSVQKHLCQIPIKSLRAKHHF